MLREVFRTLHQNLNKDKNAYKMVRFYCKRLSRSEALLQTMYDDKNRFDDEALIDHQEFIDPKQKSALTQQENEDHHTVEVWRQHPQLPEKQQLLEQSVALKEAMAESRRLLQNLKESVMSPGLVVGVSINGQEVWSAGIGYSDIENAVPCQPETVMRIGSISKPITMAAVAKLWESGKLDLDKPVQTYVPSFPEKYYNGEKVVITTRHLVTHLSGIRHYKEKQDDNPRERHSQGSVEQQTKTAEVLQSWSKDLSQENCNKDKYHSIEAALDLFKHDDLVHAPGTRFLYSTYGWTLVSAVVEAVAGEDFPSLMKKMFADLGMKHTYLEENETVIYNRARFYVQKNGLLVNAPYVDNSYKWAGGGILSTVGDIIKFGNIMLNCYQSKDSSVAQQISLENEAFIPCMGESGKCCRNVVAHLGKVCVTAGGTMHNNHLRKITHPETMVGLSHDRHLMPAARREYASLCSGKPVIFNANHFPKFLQSRTMQALWTPLPGTKALWDCNYEYGMGWRIMRGKTEDRRCHNQLHFSHTGKAVGATSVIVVLPRRWESVKLKPIVNPPDGVVVALMVNMQTERLNKTAFQIAKIFEDAYCNNK